MARGDMKVDVLSVSNEVEILNRKEFEAIPNTVDFDGVETKDDLGRKVVKAGTPIGKDGAAIKATPWTGAVGILLHDAYETRPQQAVLKKAYVNTTRAQKSSGLTYDLALVTELEKSGCRIVLEEPEVLA